MAGSIRKQAVRLEEDMNLVENMMDACVIMNKSKVSDGEGGFTTEWTEGAEILAAITYNTSMSALIAQKEGVTSTYTITTYKENELDFHDVIKRVKDGRIFRVTSEAGDIVAPAISSLNMAQVTAEKWELT